MSCFLNAPMPCDLTSFSSELMPMNNAWALVSTGCCITVPVEVVRTPRTLFRRLPNLPYYRVVACAAVRAMRTPLYTSRKKGGSEDRIIASAASAASEWAYAHACAEPRNCGIRHTGAKRWAICIGCQGTKGRSASLTIE